jgi:hypothetical protein
MQITVKYRNGKIGLVDDSELDKLIQSRKIIGFLRLEGWVTVGRDPIRQFRKGYGGPDKRRRHLKTVIGDFS